MENQTANNYIISNINQLPLANISNIVSYLDQQTINTLHQTILTHINTNNPFFSFVNTYAFLNKFIYGTDRSIYLSFYSDKFFIQNQHLSVTQTCMQMTKDYSYLFNLFNNLVCKLKNQLSQLDSEEEIVGLFSNCYVDPQLPFPKMRKQGIGMHSNSSFQFFLVDLTFNKEKEPLMDQVLENMEQFFFCLKNQQIKLVGERIKDQQFVQIIDIMKFRPQAINLQNYQKYLIKDFHTHNIIVLTLAKLDLILQMYKKYIYTLANNFDRFIQFVMRFCIYRNMILDLQEKLGFIFRIYGQILVEGQKKDEKLDLNLWRPALKKWYGVMHQHHQNNNEIFIFMLDKIRKNNLQNNLSIIFSQEPHIKLMIQNLLAVNRFCLQNKKLIKPRQYSQIQAYFQQNTDLYQQVLHQYTQYLIDISINPVTVHWCGHTSQQLSSPYQQFDQILTKYNIKYFRHIAKVIKSKKKTPQQTVQYLKMIFKYQIQYLQGSLIKPISLKQIIDDTNDLLKMLSRQNEVQCIQINWQQKNKMIQYYNTQAGIQFNMEAQNKKYYQITMSYDCRGQLCNQILKFSSQTNDTENKQDIMQI